jgi:hypothetical protein
MQPEGLFSFALQAMISLTRPGNYFIQRDDIWS